MSVFWLGVGIGAVGLFALELFGLIVAASIGGAVERRVLGRRGGRAR